MTNRHTTRRRPTILALCLSALAAVVGLAGFATPGDAAGSINGRWCAGDQVLTISAGQTIISNKRADVTTTYRASRKQRPNGHTAVTIQGFNGRTQTNGFQRASNGNLVQYFAGGSRTYQRC